MPGSVTDLGRTVTGVAVREGAPVPDISTPEAFKQALLKAKTVAYTDPKAGGSGGIMFAALLEKLGIAEAVNKKAVLGSAAPRWRQSIAEGRAEIGTTFISEVLPREGRQVVVGPLPGELHSANTYTAAIPPAASSARRRSLCCARSPIPQPATAGPRPAWSRRFTMIPKSGHRFSGKIMRQ